MTNGPFDDDDFKDPEPDPPKPPPPGADPAQVATAKKLLANTELKQLGGKFDKAGLTDVAKSSIGAFRKAHPDAKPADANAAYHGAFREIIEETFG